MVGICASQNSLGCLINQVHIDSVKLMGHRLIFFPCIGSEHGLKFTMSKKARRDTIQLNIEF